MPPRLVPTLALFILLTAGMLRLAGLESSPPGLFRDEVEKGYTALELWTTGRHGILGAEGVRLSAYFPLFIEVYDGHDQTSSVYQVLSAPVVGIFGLGVWQTRLVAALAGCTLVICLWGMAYRIFGAVPALAALIVAAFDPTQIIFSRWAQQSILATLFLTAGMWVMLEIRRMAERHQRPAAVLGALLFAGAAWSYDPVRLLAPMLFAALLLHRRTRLTRPEIIATGLFAVLWIPLLVFTLTSGSARLARVGVEGDIAERIGSFFANIAAHLDPRFLLWEGDANPRHRLPGNGFLGWTAIVILLFRLAWTFLPSSPDASTASSLHSTELKSESRSVKSAAPHPGGTLELLFLAWFLLALVPAALTRDGIPHALRAAGATPAVALLAACVVARFANSGYRMVFLAALLVAAIPAILGTVRLRHEAPGPWEGGVAESLRAGLGAPGRVMLSAEIPYASFRALWAERTDPRAYQKFGLGALRTKILPPGAVPALGPGDVLIAPPRPGINPELQAYAGLVYTSEGAFAPPKSKH